MFDEQVDAVLREVCLEIEKRYEIKFVEIGVDKDHVHYKRAISPNLQCDQTCHTVEKSECTRSVQTLPSCETTAMGW